MIVSRFAFFGASLSLALLSIGSIGCGEVFTANSGGNGGNGAGNTTETQNGGSGGGTGSGTGCSEGTTESCYDGPPGTENKGICKSGNRTCDKGVWSACNDQVLPAAKETCEPDNTGNAVDENCDGTIDEKCSCMDGTKADCYDGPSGTAGVGQCTNGKSTCENGMSGPCIGSMGPTTEICDMLDNDCDGQADDFGGACIAQDALGECKAGTEHCVDDSGAPACLPGAEAAEKCDKKDNNCDGVIDNVALSNTTNCQIRGCSGKNLCAGGNLFCIPAVEVCGDNVDNNCDGVKDPLNVPIFIETFGTGNTNSWGLDTEWQIGTATASTGAPSGFFNDPSEDATIGLDNMLAGVVIGGNASNVVHEPRYLTSPKKDLSSTDGAVYLVFKRWLNTVAPPQMSSTVDVFDGNNWVTIWHTPLDGGVMDSQWKAQLLEVTPFKNQNFRFRFGVEVISPGALQVSSWNIDDVALVRCVSTAP